MLRNKVIIRRETKDDYEPLKASPVSHSGMYTAPAAWSTMCCTAIGVTRRLCRSWTL